MSEAPTKTAKKWRHNPAKEHHRKGKPRGLGSYGRPNFNQAQKIIARFGGESAFARAVGINRITAYRYSYSRPYGTDGLIPAAAVEAVMVAARREGIVLTPNDWLVERIIYTDELTVETYPLEEGVPVPED